MTQQQAILDILVDKTQGKQRTRTCTTASCHDDGTGTP